MWLLGIFLSEFSPNPVTPQMEWVELYNDSENSVDVTGYSIHDSTSSNKQILSGAIPANSYYAFSFDHNFLNNTSSDIVRLFDNNNNLIDSQSSKSISSGLTFSRQTDGTWCPTDATPNNQNILCKDSYSLQNSPTPIAYISLKIINLDADKETIEISNDNNFSVSLFDWRVRDNSGSIRKLSCVTVNPNSSCQSTFSSGYLNNDSDTLTLLDPLKREISIYKYENLKRTIIKPTTINPPTKSPLSKGDLGGLKQINIQNNINNNYIASHSSTSVKINQSTPIHNYLSIILMLIGSVFILFPLIFHAKNKH